VLGSQCPCGGGRPRPSQHRAPASRGKARLIRRPGAAAVPPTGVRVPARGHVWATLNSARAPLGVRSKCAAAGRFNAVASISASQRGASADLVRNIVPFQPSHLPAPHCHPAATQSARRDKHARGACDDMGLEETSALLGQQWTLGTRSPNLPRLRFRACRALARGASLVAALGFIGLTSMKTSALPVSSAERMPTHRMARPKLALRLAGPSLAPGSRRRPPHT
jgi:hypothetical protein